MRVLQEFKTFALRGNVIDMAVGIIIGGAFGALVNSLVNDVIMPPIGYITSDVDFKSLSATLKPADEKVVNGQTIVVRPAVKLNYGAFINNVVTFSIVAWAVFLLVKAVNVAETKLRLGQQPPDAPPPPEDILLLREIRDALKRT